MSSRKAPPGSPGKDGPARKKAKIASSSNSGTQTGLGAFIKVSPQKQQKASSRGNNGGSKDTAVIDLSSDDDEEKEDGECKPSTSKAAQASSSRTPARDVIDLEDVKSEPEIEIDVKPKRANGAPLHPMFAARPITIDEDEDVKDVKPDLKGKGRAKPQDSPIKLIIPESNGSDPVAYPLDTDIFSFDPKTDISTSSWPRNGAGKLQIPYSFLVASFVFLSATRSRLINVTVLTNTLRTVVEYQPEVLRETVYLLTNHVAPAYEGIELGVGGQVLGKALKAVSGVTQRDLKLLWNQHGDFGDVAFHAKSKIRTLFASQPITLLSLYNNLVTLTALKGSGTVNKKADIIQRMLVAAKGEEVRFLVRTLVAHLRTGAVRLTVTASLARAFCLIAPAKAEEGDEFYISPEEKEGVRAVAKTVKEGKDDPRRLLLMARLAKAEALVREVYVRHPNYDNIVPALLRFGLQGLSEAIPLQVGTPLSPMLGQITRDLGDVSKRLEPTREFAAEWKYDGQRVQIHCERRKRGSVPAGESKLSSKKGGGQWVEGTDVYVRLFSRHLEDMTGKYPDILQLMPQMLSPITVDASGEEQGVQSFIMDAEIVAIDPVTKALLTFQTLTNRARKDVNIHDVKVKVGVFAFDLMYLNGKTLINKSFRERRNLLKTRFPPREPTEASIARFDHVRCMEGFPNNLEPIRQFMLEAIAQKCEGLMLKLLDSAEMTIDIDKEEELDDDNTADEEEQEEDGDAAVKAEDDADADADAAENKKRGRRKALLATYEPDKRVESWLKVKRDYGDLGDSLDVVPVGAWHGQGRKTGWWSPILLAVYNPETGGFQALCKCISGFTDQFYKDLNERYKKGSETCSSTLKTYVDSGLRPDVWWQPSEVWEIRGADLTLSPVYTAALGLVSDERGLSLRFPRFIKVREDKGIEQATTPEDLAAAFQRQSEGHKAPREKAESSMAPADGGFD